MPSLAGLRSFARDLFTPDPSPLTLERQAYFAAQTAGMALSSTRDPRIAGAGLAGDHAILRLTREMSGMGFEHRTQLTVLHAMRQFYPTLDAAIVFRRILEGDMMPMSDDEGLQRELQELWATVPVGYVDGAGQMRGGDEYADLLSDAADEYGYAAGEIQLDETGRGISRLVVPNARTLSLREVDGSRQAPGGTRYQLHQLQDGRDVALTGSLVQALAFRPSSESPWPLPMAWSLVQTTEAVLRMYQSLQQAWWRYGDPSMLLGIEYDPEFAEDLKNERVAGPGGTSVEVPREVVRFKSAVEQIMAARRTGQVGDAYVATTGKIVNEVLGEVEASMMRYFREHTGLFDAQVVAASSVPVWMFASIQRPGDGLGGSLSNNENAIAATAAHKRNAKRADIAIGVCDAHLIANGDARHLGKYWIEHSEVNIMDQKAIEETRKLAAEAAAAHIENAVELYDEDGNPRFKGEALRYLEDQEVV